MRLSIPIYQLKRRAKAAARQNNIPLHQSLDSVARQEGFQNWGLLAAKHADRSQAARLISALASGDVVLLGARPGHGKTMLGLELAVETLKDGASAAFYSLEYTEQEVAERLASFGANGALNDANLTLDTTDTISADYIIAQLGRAERGTLVVIDYLQALDHDRSKPALDAQVSALKSFAETTGAIIILISQIDRSFDPSEKPLPDVTDIRLPNALDINLFTKTVFLNNGTAELQPVG